MAASSKLSPRYYGVGSKYSGILTCSSAWPICFRQYWQSVKRLGHSSDICAVISSFAIKAPHTHVKSSRSAEVWGGGLCEEPMYTTWLPYSARRRSGPFWDRGGESGRSGAVSSSCKVSEMVASRSNDNGRERRLRRLPAGNAKSNFRTKRTQ